MKKIFILVMITLFFRVSMAQTWTGDGTGTETDPYQIRTAEELNAVRYFLTAHFRLMNDIDLTEWLNAHEGDKGWNPIGVNTMAGAFQGTFHGGGHTISGLWIERPAMDEVGLFGVIHDDFSIDSLTIRIADNKRIAGHDYVGGLAGMIESDTFSDAIKYISNISVFGNVYGNTRVGGLIGYCAWREIYVCNSYFMGSVSGTMYCVGGLIGEYDVIRGHVMDCYAVGKVTGNGAVGGLIGINFLGYIERCYSASMVKGNEGVGGLMGDNVHGILKGGEGDKIKDCYSFSKVKGHCYTGGLVGQNDAANIINSYSYGTVVGDDRTGGIMGGDTTETQWTSSMKNCVAMQYHILGSTNTGRVSGINTITIPENCYAFDQMEIVPQGNHYVHGEDRTLQQLQQQNSYTDIHWLFGDNQNNPWNIWEEISFPYLYYQSAPVIIKSANTKQISGILRNPTDSVLLFLFIDDAYILAGKADITGLQWKANISVDIDVRDTVFVLSFENKKSCSYPVSALFIMGEVTDVEVYPKEITLAVGEITTLQATVIPETAMNHRVIWTTHNPAIADVDDNGNVMAIAIGSTYIVATTEDGNKKDSCLVHVIASNIEDIAFDNRIIIIPNPTNGELKISLPNPSEGGAYEAWAVKNIEIFDVFGKTVMSVTSSPSGRLGGADISHLPTGMYFLRIKTENGIITKKVIKQ